jgi:hypothetical protein
VLGGNRTRFVVTGSFIGANYILLYGNKLGAVALKAPQEHSPGQRPGSWSADEGAPYKGARVRSARSTGMLQLRGPPPDGISLTPAAPSGRPEFQLTQGAALG